jgi:hypothetical protein
MRSDHRTAAADAYQTEEELLLLYEHGTSRDC